MVQSRVLLLVMLLRAVHGDAYHCPYQCRCSTSASVLCRNGALRSVPQSLFPNTTDLSIVFNKISVLHNHSFSHLPMLWNIELTGNYITAIEPGAFRNLKRLVRLVLSTNGITQLDPNSFP